MWHLHVLTVLLFLELGSGVAAVSGFEDDPKHAIAIANERLFDELIAERKNGEPSSAWAEEAEKTAKWSRESDATVSRKLRTECQTEVGETEKWITELAKELHDEDESEQGTATDRAAGLAITSLGRRTEMLTKMVTRLNGSIEHVNHIFSDAHATSIAGMVEHVFKIRLTGLEIRSVPDLQDPVFNPIALQSESSDEGMSFIDLGAFSDRLDAVAAEAEAHLETDAGITEASGLATIKGSIAKIRDDMKFWKKLKGLFEQERAILAQLRNELGPLLKLRAKQLFDLEEMQAEVKEANAEEGDSELARSKFELLPKLKTHLQNVKRNCGVAMSQK